MTKNDMIYELNSFIKTNYAKQIADLNKAVITTPVIEGEIEAPGFKITPGGGTLIKGLNVTVLNPPAELKVELSKKSVLIPTYRIVLPFDEVSFACSNAGYMKTLIGFTLNQAVSNYNFTFGGPEVTRYGEAYLFLPEVSDYKDDFLLTLQGKYADGAV